MNVTLSSMAPLLVDVLLGLSVLIVLVSDLILPPSGKKALGYLTTALLGVCLAATFLLDLHGPALGGAYVGDELALMFKRIFLTAGLLAVLGSLDQVYRDFNRRQAEYYQLLLFSLLGMTLLSGARDLILLVVSFELMGIPLYVLASYRKTGQEVGPRPAEAGLKLYLVGAVSSALTFYGLSLVYGATGATSLAAVSQAPSSPLLLVGIVMLLAGFGFKIGVAPFHMWAPDTYQGTSTPFAAFLSVAPKGAGFVALIQVLVGGFSRLQGRWMPLLVMLIVSTMVVGNLMALRQSNLKRLLGFSGVAHMGFMLMGLASIQTAGSGTATSSSIDALATVLFYLAGYTVTNLGIFLAVEAVGAGETRAVLEEVRSARPMGGGRPGRATHMGNAALAVAADASVPEPTPVVLLEERIDSLDSFAGLARREPWIGMAILVFLLSLAGIPFVVGFWAKVYVLLAAWRAGMSGLVVFGATLSVVGLFYYLQVARAMYMRPAETTHGLSVTPALATSIAFCLLATVAMGLYPAPFIEAARTAAAGFLQSL